MPHALDDAEIKRRLVRLANVERLYEELKVRYAKLQEDYDALKKENELLKATIAAQNVLIEQLKLRIEELERMVFGRRKKKHRDAEGSGSHDDPPARKPPTGRGPGSYRRPIPPADAITHTEECPLINCQDCGTALENLKTVVRYEEDVLPLSEWWKALKRVVKRLITTGYCPRCRERKAAAHLSPHTVSLGGNIKQFIAFSTVILRLGYQPIKDFLLGAVHLAVSDGEITEILALQAVALNPEFHRVKERIDAQPAAHYDETSWPVQAAEQGHFAWIRTGTETPEALFLLGRSRGKGNIDGLRGEEAREQTGVTDAYPAYDNAFAEHALCWAHPHRTFRDLAAAECLSDEKRQHASDAFAAFDALYAGVRAVKATPFILAERLQKKEELAARFDCVVAPHPLDPKKLATHKETLRGNRECYFVCITNPHVPADNNKAERGLRHLVIKRRISCGSRTQRGADMMSVLYTVLLSLWWKSKPAFFQDYARLLSP